MKKLMGGMFGSAVRRSLLTAVLFVLALMIPLSALGSSPIHAVAITHVTTDVDNHSADRDRNIPDNSVPGDPEQPEESGKAPTSPSQVVEEEVKANHKFADLTPMFSGSFTFGERVDHAYEAWFYSVTHPPLTPPPNAA